MKTTVFFSASLMCGRLLNLEYDLNTLSNSQLIDYVHIDISDGTFSGNIILGYETTNMLAGYSMPLDIHLMMNYPSRAINQLKLRPFDLVSFHIECDENPSHLITLLRKIDCKVGVFIKTDTSLEDIFPYLQQIDVVYLMMSPIGYSANISNSDAVLHLMQRAKVLYDAHPSLTIGADGGIKFEYIKKLESAGVKLFVLGKNSLFHQDIEKGLDILNHFVKNELTCEEVE
jgi:ribulose-phosphate 3-epimerase